MFILLLLTTALLLLIHACWKSRRLPPGPWGLPVVGYLPWINPKAPQLTFTDLATKYGPIYSLSLGSVLTVVISDVKIIRSLFAKDSTTGRAPLYVTHGIMHGYGLICSEGALWKDQRKFVANWLRSIGATKVGSQRRKLESLILKHAKELVSSLEEIPKPIDPLSELRHHVGSFITEVVFGKSWPKTDEKWVWLQDTQEEGTRLIGVAAPLNFLPFLRFLPMFKQSMSFLTEGKNETHRFYRKLIEEEEEKILSDRSRSPDLDTNTPCTSLIQGFLMEKEKRRKTEDVDKYYCDQQFYHLLADIFGASLDTTLTTLRWFILFLSLNEDLQSEVRNEIGTILNGRLPSMDDCEFMPLTEACIAETQRIRSVVPVGIPHGTLAEVTVAGYVIPKGTMVIPLQWAIHMDQKRFDRPEVFNPKNFLNEEGKFCKDDAFIPFQCGKRMCVGDELARMMLFLFGVSILQNFGLKLDDKDNVRLEGDPGITLTPKPFKVSFTSL